MTRTIIDRFDGEFAFLSNFYLVPGGVEMDGVIYRTVEHAYQAAKTLDPWGRLRVRRILVGPEDHPVERDTTPAEAKRRGRENLLRPDWDRIKVDIMRSLLKEKFKEPDLRVRLLATRGAVLVEGNWWGDTFWGVCRGEGLNYLGLILMEVRDEIREEFS